MNVIEIIKESFLFPSKNMKILLIFELLSIVAGIFAGVGTIVYILGFISPEYFMWGGLAAVISMVIGLVLSGYLITVVKSGIEHDDEVPGFVWWDNFIEGFNYLIVSIVYYLIPAFIVAIVGFMTNIYGHIITLFQEIFLQIVSIYLGSASILISAAIIQTLIDLAIALTVTATVAVIVFTIFSFLQTMAGARLANTGSLTEALNVFESAKDISRIGIGKVIFLIIAIIVIVGAIEMVLSFVYSYIPFLSILSIIITPYLIFFTQRAIGLLYSDIA